MTHSPGRFDRVLSPSRRVAEFILRHPVFMTSLLVAGLVIGVRQMGGLQAWELAAYDQMVRSRPEQKTDSRLLIVTITEQDIRAQNRWPLPDAVIAQLLARLQQHRPRTIGLDIYRDVAHPPGHQSLLKQLQAPNIIAITLLGTEDKDGVPPPPGVPENRVGFSDIAIDPDAVVRRNLLYATVGDKEFYSFSLRASLHHLANQDSSFYLDPGEAVQIGGRVFPALAPDSGSYQTLDDQGYQVLLNYHSADTVARQVTLTQVLNGEVEPDWIRDKLVLIGTTAPSIKDLFLTPYNFSNDTNPDTPGVVIHANKVSQILNTVLGVQPLIWYWSQPSELVWIWGWSVIGGLLGWRLRHPVLLGVAGIVSVTGLFGFCLVLFLQAGWVPFVSPAIALLGSGIAVIAYRLLHDALHDELTRLPNRTLFVNYLQWAMNRSRQSRGQLMHPKQMAIAVLFVGLDSFETIHDSLGHRLADELLVAIAERLESCLRPADQLARVGGDEFAILLRQVTDISEVAHLAEQLQQQVKLPFNFGEQQVFTTASIGVVLDQPDSHSQPEDILRDAHTAMSQAKAAGKARYQVFMSGMREQVITRLQLETDLRRAIAHNIHSPEDHQEFQLHYQPIIALETGKIAGFEALIRWQHPQRGFVHPIEFISVAEETELIIPIGQWVIDEACRQIQRWQTRFPQQPPLLMSVNLSGKQFAQPDLVEQIEQTLQETGLDRRSLKLEVTESIAMTNVEETIALLSRLKALNLQISIDDFGTGYSSLSYLHRFPADTLKVDRSFVSRMGDKSEDAHIVQTIIMLGHNLKMDIVAEGVETAEQLAHLRSLNCEYGQGYFFAKPQSSDAIEQLLQSDPQW